MKRILLQIFEIKKKKILVQMAMKHVKYHVGNELPVQVRCMMLDAGGWCTGTAQRDGMGREETQGDLCSIMISVRRCWLWLQTSPFSKEEYNHFRVFAR